MRFSGEDEGLMAKARTRFNNARDRIPFPTNTRYRIVIFFTTFLLFWTAFYGVFVHDASSHDILAPQLEAVEPPQAVPAPAVPAPLPPMIEIAKLVELTKAPPPIGPGTFKNGTFFDASKAAVIMETRPLNNLIPLLLHFSTVLGPEWPVILYTSREVTHLIDSAALKTAMAAGHIIIRYLPENLHFETHFDVSLFLTQPWFWEELAPAKNILMFQADSILCANSKLRVDDFLKWDLVGAPITEKWHGQGYNGGLSLRNRLLTLSIINEDYARHPLNSTSELDIEKYEDQWFFMRFKERGARMPGGEEAMKFSVQLEWYEFPVGYHQPMEFQREHREEIERWCPEVRLIEGVELLKCEPPVC